MIQRLELQNWRAYDRLDLELGPGATFVVASNGIGKTSLIMAAAWGSSATWPACEAPMRSAAMPRQPR